MVDFDSSYCDIRALSRKQVEILHAVMKGKENGDFADNNSIRENVSYEVTRLAMLCSLKFLIRRGLVERHTEIRDNRRRACFKLTALGQSQFDVNTGEFDVIFEGFDDTL